MRQQRAEHAAANFRTPKLSLADRRKRLFREIKRRLIADGRMENPALRPKKYQYHWTVGDRDQGGIVLADHAGEARGLIKKQIGITGSKKGRRRLPACIKITRIPNDASTSPGDLPFSIKQVHSGDNLDAV